VARVALLDDYQGVALSMADWKSLPPGTEVVVFKDHLAEEDAVAKRLADFDIVMALRERTPFPRTLLERLPKLKLLITAGMRNASIDMKAAAERGVTICGTAGLPYPTAELAWGLILSLMRRIPAEDRATREGRWQTSLGLGLNGKTLGVLGLGTLGSRAAKVGLALRGDAVELTRVLRARHAVGAHIVSRTSCSRAPTSSPSIWYWASAPAGHRRARAVS
jgi:phosphoglycerate dehydrogenase-like enzyme